MLVTPKDQAHVIPVTGFVIGGISLDPEPTSLNQSPFKILFPSKLAGMATSPSILAQAQHSKA